MSAAAATGSMPSAGGFGAAIIFPCDALSAMRRRWLARKYGISYIQEFGSNRLNNALNPPFAFSQDVLYSTIDPPPARIFTGIPAPAPAPRDHAYGGLRMVDPTA